MLPSKFRPSNEADDIAIGCGPWRNTFNRLVSGIALAGTEVDS